jgi:MFS family permease
LYAPLANRYGRRITLLTGFLLALFVSALSLLAVAMHSLVLLNLCRFFQGVGSSAGLTVGMIMIADTFESTKAREIFSYVILFFSFAPTVAMFVGGYTVDHFGLMSLFVFMDFMMVLWVVVAWTFGETYSGEPIKINVGQVLSAYKAVVRSRFIVVLGLLMSMATVIMYYFNGFAPLIAARYANISASVFGRWVIIASLGLFVGALLSSVLSKRFSARLCAAVGLFFMSLGAGCLAATLMCLSVSIFALLAPAFLIFLGAAIVIPNASMAAITYSSDRATTSASINSVALLLSAIVVSVGGQFIHFGPMMLPVFILALCLVGWALLALSKSNH